MIKENQKVFDEIIEASRISILELSSTSTILQSEIIDNASRCLNESYNSYTKLLKKLSEWFYLLGYLNGTVKETMSACRNYLVKLPDDDEAYERLCILINLRDGIADLRKELMLCIKTKLIQH